LALEAELMEPYPQFMTVREFAALAHVSQSTVWRMLRDGTLPYERFGKRGVRIDSGAMLKDGHAFMRDIARNVAVPATHEVGFLFSVGEELFNKMVSRDQATGEPIDFLEITP
jgi:excisionase family DNA binding protein